MPKKKREAPCEHMMFDTLGGDKLCAKGCGLRVKGEAEEFKVDDKRKQRAMILAALEGDDAELLALLEDG